jgi:hypothetical protein
MVRSLAAIGVVVAVVVLLMPQRDGPDPRPVDVEELATASADEADFDLVVADLPSGWRATSARLRADGPDGTLTWHVGYLTPSEGYAGLEVARDVTSGWVEDQTSAGEPDDDAGPTIDVAGRPWQLLRSDEPRRASLVREADGVTTVVTGSAQIEELLLLAREATG